MGSLKSSIVLMRAINKNDSSQAIGVVFENDFQLVAMLESYLLHNHCIEWNGFSKSGWIVTSTGQGWISQIAQYPLSDPAAIFVVYKRVKAGQFLRLIVIESQDNVACILSRLQTCQRHTAICLIDRIECMVDDYVMSRFGHHLVNSSKCDKCTMAFPSKVGLKNHKSEAHAY